MPSNKQQTRSSNRQSPKDRASRLKGRAPKRRPSQPAPDPRLVAMVEQWRDLGRQIEADGADDAAISGLSERHTALQIEIYRFPASSIADLLTKVPVFQDEMEDAVPGLVASGDPGHTLGRAAWLGLFRDFEHLNGQGGAGPAGAPSGAAELDFTPWDIHGTCPTPTRDQWLEMADTALPWLRLGFAFMCDTKAELGQKFCEMERDLFDRILDGLTRERRNFRGIADLADIAVKRVLVAMEAHAAARGVDVDAEAATHG